MLSAQDNELITKVGPGTPMGALLRQYWIPALTSQDLPEPDCAPVRVRLLGENLIAFRVTSGKVGLVANSCPHRGASLFFARNEQEGLRCVYHGWKFDTTGQCIDMPSEPAESNFKTKVGAVAYPCIERNGIIWTYMGPRETPPPLPDIEANMQPEPSRAQRTLRYCNWLQGLEGDIDTSHSEYLHSPAVVDVASLTPGSGAYYRHRLREPFRFVVTDTNFGASYGAYRPAEDDTTYWRIAHFLFPFYVMTPSPAAGSTMMVRIWVPLDDEHVMFWSVSAGAGMNLGGPRAAGSGTIGTGGNEYLPDSTDWLGRHRSTQMRENDYLLDRDVQKTVTFTGINGTVMQDQAMTESMGVIYQRDHEHLGTSDSMIIRTRRRLLNATKALCDEGVIPPGVDNSEIYRTRSGWVFLPRNVDWLDGTAELRQVLLPAPPASMIERQ